jgi:hypothetical protein
MHTRRNLLGTIAVAATAAVAGCSGTGDGGDSEAPDSVRLEELSAQNADDEGHRIQVAVEADGEMIHLGTYQLDGGESRTIDGAWTDEAGSYRVHTRLDDGGVRTADVTEGIAGGADCVRVLARIDERGELAVWNGANCGSGSGSGSGTGPGTDDAEFENA